MPIRWKTGRVDRAIVRMPFDFHEHRLVLELSTQRLKQRECTRIEFVGAAVEEHIDIETQDELAAAS